MDSHFSSSTVLCAANLTPHSTSRHQITNVTSGESTNTNRLETPGMIFSPRESPMVPSQHASYQENGTRIRRKTGDSGNNLSDIVIGETFASADSAQQRKKSEDVGTSPKPSDFTFFAGNSTLHGINHIFLDGRWTLRRFLWGAAFFSSLGIFLLQAYDRYAYYISHPHVTKLDELEAEIMDFPAITICNMNSFRLSQITTSDYYNVGRQIFELFDDDYQLRENGFRDNRTWPVVLNKVKPILRQRKDYKPNPKNFNMFEFYNRTGHDLTDLLLSCSYRGKNCKSARDWNVVFTRYGKCYTFNSGEKYEPLTTLKGGIDNGLELLLDTQQNEYMPVWDESDEISVEAGFKVQIHVQHEPPFIHELGFGVSPGFQTLIATQEQRITFLPDPWGDCVDKFDRKQHYHFDNYSISACRITCETKFVLDNCSCRMIHMPGNTTYCTPEEYKKCADRALDYLLEKDEQNCNCKTPCLVTRYNLEMSTLRLPSTQATSYLAWKYNVTETYVKDNFVKLNIFFEALNYETIEQKVAYEVAGLLGDIGGQMGLFIGASILTILELFDYVYEFIKDKTWGKNLRKARNEAEQQASLAATTSLLVEKSEKDATSNIMSPSVQYHAVPGTIAMAFPQQRPNHFNGISAIPTRHEVPTYSNSQPHHGGINQSRSMPYNTMPYKSPMNCVSNHNSNRGLRYTKEPMPPPPPQYLGQSMMTLRGDIGVPEMALTKRYNGGRAMTDGSRAETSRSYNDLVHIGDHGDITEDEDIDYRPRHGNHISQLARYSAGIATLPQFRGPAMGFEPVSSIMPDDYIPPFTRHNYGYNECVTPTKLDYSKTLETDIH